MYDPNEEEELGFLQALIPLGASLLGGMLGGNGGGSERGGAAGLTGAIQPLLESILPALRGTGVTPGAPLAGVGVEQIRDVVRNLIREVPPPIRAQVTEALTAARAEGAKAQDIVRSVDRSVQPRIAAAMSALTLAQNQRSATSEHRDIVERDAFRQHQRAGTESLNAKMDRVLGRLGASAIVSGPAVNVLGGRSVLGVPPRR